MTPEWVPKNITPDMPLVPPPPGITSNFVDPPSRRQEVVVCVAVCLALSITFLLGRMLTRAFITRSLGWDDYTCVIATATAIAMSIVALDQTNYGYGRHSWDINMLTWVESWIQAQVKISVIWFLLYQIAMGLVKVSILLLYLRLIPKDTRKTRIAVYWVLAFTVATSVASELLLLFSCWPVRKLFDPYSEGVTRVSPSQLGLAQTIMNIVSDFLILAVPIPMVLRLQLSWKQKLQVLAMFTTGAGVCFVSLARLKIVVDGLKGFPDPQYEIAGTVWTVIEVSLAIICSCLPAWKQLLWRSAPYIQSIYSNNKSSGSKGSSGEKARSSPKNPRSKAGQPQGPRTSDSLRADGAYLELGPGAGNESKVTTGSQSSGDDLEKGYATPEGEQSFRHDGDILKTVGVNVHRPSEI
ncbi:MAG: hypothetical protein M1837_002874 [Sclerophora amabilis]|nr:MAG: hypothetical protein M1837_002874 [Sclerophora amabilis]